MGSLKKLLKQPAKQTSFARENEKSAMNTTIMPDSVQCKSENQHVSHCKRPLNKSVTPMTKRIRLAKKADNDMFKFTESVFDSPAETHLGTEAKPVLNSSNNGATKDISVQVDKRPAPPAADNSHPRGSGNRQQLPSRAKKSVKKEGLSASALRASGWSLCGDQLQIHGFKRVDNLQETLFPLGSYSQRDSASVLPLLLLGVAPTTQQPEVGVLRAALMSRLRDGPVMQSNIRQQVIEIMRTQRKHPLPSPPHHTPLSVKSLPHTPPQTQTPITSPYPP